MFVSKIENTCLKCRHLLTPCFLVLSSKSCKFSLQKTLLQIAFSWQRFAASHYNIDKYFSATSRSKLNLFQIILPDNFLADCFFFQTIYCKICKFLFLAILQEVCLQILHGDFNFFKFFQIVSFSIFCQVCTLLSQTTFLLKTSAWLAVLHTQVQAW